MNGWEIPLVVLAIGGWVTVFFLWRAAKKWERAARLAADRANAWERAHNAALDRVQQ